MTPERKLLTILRWVCVLPAALLGDIVVQFVIGAVVQLAGYGGWGVVGDSNIAYALRIFLYYVPRKSAFVIVGAMMAPRHQMAAATALTVFGFLFSLITHVIGQHLVGNKVGIVNYMHLLAEFAGMLGGAAYMLLKTWSERRTDMTT